MWVCLNNAFLSIVEPDRKSGDKLLVRARRKGDIERVFPGIAVKRTPERDYLFRALISRERVAEAIANEVRGIDYGNFKASVRDKPLHDAYASVWSIMARQQESAPYSGASRANVRGQGRLL